jgi:hypothetical protein
MRHYCSVTWQDGSFLRTAAILSFASKKARAAFPAQCSQRVVAISAPEAKRLRVAGHPTYSMLWDSADPTVFYSAKEE